MNPVSDLIQQLIEIVGSEQILTADQLRERSTSFWDATPMQGKVLVKPANTEEVSAAPVPHRYFHPG